MVFISMPVPLIFKVCGCFFQVDYFHRMDERTVDFDSTSPEVNIGVEDGTGLDHLVLDNIESEGSSWKFCNSTTLPRSEVVFYQALIGLLLILTMYLNSSFSMPFAMLCPFG